MNSGRHLPSHFQVCRRWDPIWLVCALACAIPMFAAGCASSGSPVDSSVTADETVTPSITAAPSSAPPTTATSTPRTLPPSVASATMPARPDGQAMAALRLLTVKGRAPKTGYARDQFGQGWSDLNGDGCDTRNEILMRDLRDVRLKQGSDCVVASGVLNDPYSGTTLQFVRGTDTSSDVQIDHVVALGDAWQKGAQQLPPQVREALANDPLNLLAVQGRVNTAKGDSDSASWLPPNKSFRCSYVARQTAVKLKYGLWVTPAERDAIERILASCPGQPLPNS